MKQPYYPLLAFSALVLVIMACGLPLAGSATPASPPSQDAVSTAVALTFQALTPTGAPVTQPPLPDAGLLPHSLYYLGMDNSGLTQVFRIEKDGQTIRQVTTEPLSISNYGVSPVDGSVVYVVNNQLLLVDAAGTGRRLLVDGGTVDEINPFLNTVTNPVFSPDGQTLAYGFHGLNLYSLSSGANTLVSEDKINDMGSGMILPTELYRPEEFSPDGSKLLLTLGYYEGASAAIYDLQTRELVRLKNDQGSLVCCDLMLWSADGTKIYSANPAMGMFSAGMWMVDPGTGDVTTLLASNFDTSTFNMAKYPYLAPDNLLYYFFLESNTGEYSRTPLQLVRSAADGVTGRTALREETFDMMNEALWSPDASSVIVAYAPDEATYQGGQAEIVYVDGRPNVVLTSLARNMQWGP